MSAANTPPSLCSISQCRTELNFEPLAHWPVGLPAVAVNGWVLAGFSQDLVFNHHLKENDHASFLSLFHSLHQGLSFVELARLWSKAQNVSWFPFAQIAESYHFRLNEQFEKMSEAALKLPMGFQNWCAAKKLGPADLVALLSAGKMDLNPVLQKILFLKLSKSDGVQALELCVDLLLMSVSLDELGVIQGTDRCESLSLAPQWLEHLKALRFPNSVAADKGAEESLAHLPWPGSSQVKWARQGDKAGIEVRLFVSRPEDLKRYAKSFEKIQDLLESNQGELWKKH